MPRKYPKRLQRGHGPTPSTLAIATHYYHSAIKAAPEATKRKYWCSQNFFHAATRFLGAENSLPFSYLLTPLLCASFLPRERAMRVWVVTSLLVAGMLVTGTLNTIAAKVQNETRAPGLDGRVKSFSHPWHACSARLSTLWPDFSRRVQTYFMFSGELLCLLALAFLRLRERCAPNLHGIRSGKHVPATCDPIFALPTLCDLISSSLGGVGLLYTPVRSS